MLCFLLLSVHLLMAVWVASSVGFCAQHSTAVAISMPAYFEPLLSLLLNAYQRAGYSFMVYDPSSVLVCARRTLCSILWHLSRIAFFQY